eukprot:g14685.t1
MVFHGVKACNDAHEQYFDDDFCCKMYYGSNTVEEFEDLPFSQKQEGRHGHGSLPGSPVTMSRQFSDSGQHHGSLPGSPVRMSSQFSDSGQHHESHDRDHDNNKSKYEQ